MLQPDYSFFIQIGLFLLLWACLKQWWFDPAMKVLKKRNARSAGAIEEARKVQAEAEQLRREHAIALEQTKAEAQREVHDILRNAEAEQKRLLTEATDDAHRTLADVRSRVAEEVAVARKELRADVETIAREVARTIMGRAV
ncbi:MAG TPA: ATP synthase F0 subunit B [Candidatus Binatia bacterium]|jgi:F-type H+-transporting ATPase subunit b|nr:ATP synthase F0 subunit B [Candidatus Binatia bacterium]